MKGSVMATNLFDCHYRGASYLRRQPKIAKAERRSKASFDYAEAHPIFGDSQRYNNYPTPRSSGHLEKVTFLLLAFAGTGKQSPVRQNRKSAPASPPIRRKQNTPCIMATRDKRPTTETPFSFGKIARKILSNPRKCVYLQTQ